MHYWFVESMSNPATDPVAFWTNGGPGCSGLIGFMTEQGPFRPLEDGSLKMNDYAWNQKANMVFIEAPCGVGFSYSTDDSGADYKTDDDTTAANNYALIQAFFARYPEYNKNDMYITSESYGGHYMPTLSKKIVDMNTAGENPILNFKGFAVGNPQTTFYSAIPSGLATYWGHQLVSKPTWDKYDANCLTKGSFNFSICEELFLEMYMEIGDLNPYALDYPVCTDDNRRKMKSGRNQRNFLLQHLMSHADEKIKSAMGMVLKADDYEPCADDWSVTYLNRADVKKAIHVKGDVNWEQCSRSIKYKQTDGMHSMTPIYNYLIDGKYGLKILVYSGDDDSVCSTEGSQKWIWDLGYEVKGRRWQQYKVSNQTAGYMTQWKNTGLTFMTVHGAGHEVPTYQPEIALYLFNEYIAGSLNN